ITLRDEGQIAQKKEARIAKPERQDQEKFERHDKVDAVTPRTPAATERVAEEQNLPAKQEALRERAAANEVAAAPPAATAMAKTMIGRPAAPPSEIVSSNPGSRWRIIGGGAVQRSMDGGATWQVQQTGVNVALTAGDSPSPSVCWLVGPS